VVIETVTSHLHEGLITNLSDVPFLLQEQIQDDQPQDYVADYENLEEDYSDEELL